MGGRCNDKEHVGYDHEKHETHEKENNIVTASPIGRGNLNIYREFKLTLGLYPCKAFALWVQIVDKKHHLCKRFAFRNDNKKELEITKVGDGNVIKNILY